MFIFFKLYKIFVQLFYYFVTTFDTEVLFATLSITALYHYAVCRYAESCILFTVLLNVFMLNDIILNVIIMTVVKMKYKCCACQVAVAAQWLSTQWLITISRVQIYPVGPLHQEKIAKKRNTLAYYVSSSLTKKKFNDLMFVGNDIIKRQGTLTEGAGSVPLTSSLR